MCPFASSMLCLFLLLSPVLSKSLSGTWMSKSKTVLTGPGIYDPIDELLFEPSLPGICYSFDDDGNWEKASYQVQANPTSPDQPTAVIIWQHGKYKIGKDGSLDLVPYPSDGRQLFSDPSRTKNAIYMRYTEEEKMDHFVIEYDYYHSKYKLQMYAFDGKKKQPLWLEYDPPVMLPTKVLNPVDKKQKLSQANRRIKRSLENRERSKALGVKRDCGFEVVTPVVLVVSAVMLWFLLRRIAATRRELKMAAKMNSRES